MGLDTIEINLVLQFECLYCSNWPKVSGAGIGGGYWLQVSGIAIRGRYRGLVSGAGIMDSQSGA